MLSRVAERIYWMARYIERAENTARIVNVNSILLLDLPKSLTPGWRPLIDITGSKADFEKRRRTCNERNVVHFLVADLKYSGSLLSSLQFARENARTIRDIIPREAWEHINALYLNTKNALPGGLAQRARFDFLGSVISGTQQITGLLAGTMLHDAGYFFLRMGRNLERADMTTRIIDVRSGDLLENEHENLTPYENIQWMSVLKSLTAYQMYRRTIQVRVRRPDVLNFLFKERNFPRAFYHTLCEVESSLEHLPRNKDVKKKLKELQKFVLDVEPATLKQNDLHEFIDTLQLKLSEIHNEISEVYFRTQT